MVAALVDEVRGERPDRIGAEAATLGVGREEQVDAGMAEVGFGLLDRLDVADDSSSTRIAKPSSSGSPPPVRSSLDAVEAEGAPPARDGGLGKDGGERRCVSGLDRSKDDLPSAQLHALKISENGHDIGRTEVDRPASRRVMQETRRSPGA